MGRPDYTPEVAVSKPIVGVLQNRWSVLWTPTAVAADSMVQSDLYTVPDGYRLHIGASIITCSASIIQMVRMVHTPGIIGDYRYDVKGELIFGPDSATVLEAGDTLTVYVFNNDVVPRDFSVSMTGVVERVA